MAEYIEREVAMKALPDDMYGYLHRRILRTIPAADVKPAVRGTWDKHMVSFYWRCCECGAIMRSNLSEVFLCDNWKINYCPNCGADMREADNEVL